MKITATKEEYETLMFALGRSTECPIITHCCPVGDLQEQITCEECVRRSVDWEELDGRTD